ncbi:MAG TPA: response regulator [Epsilonproteobacteria bacterium]|nr:response regulator [Campylobacterota bacterium]
MELTYNVLIVDDVVDNIQIAMNMLKEENYNLTFALSGEEALSLIENNSYDMILLDIMMPEIDGFTVCARIKKIPEYEDVPIIFLTAKNDIDSVSHAFSVGAVDYVSKPFHAEELLARVRNHLELYRSRLVLKNNHLTLQIKAKEEKERLLTELEEGQKELIYILTELIESASPETGQHIKRVSEISKLLASYHPAIDKNDEEIIFHAAPMHDIGKVTIPHAILSKPGALTNEEFEVMKTHASAGHQFLKNSQRKILKTADIIASEHHEKWDGTGYPQGLKGEEIHVFGRIVAIADVFDALTHKRCYKEAWSIEDSVAYMLKHKGTHFDPMLIDIFMEHLDEFVTIVHP